MSLRNGQCLGWGANQHGCIRQSGEPAVLTPVIVEVADVLSIKDRGAQAIAPLPSATNLAAGKIGFVSGDPTKWVAFPCPKGHSPHNRAHSPSLQAYGAQCRTPSNMFPVHADLSFFLWGLCWRPLALAGDQGRQQRHLGPALQWRVCCLGPQLATSDQCLGCVGVVRDSPLPK